MTFNFIIIPIVLALTLLTPRSLASQGKLTPKQLDKINSMTELKNLLEERASVVEALTGKGNWTIEEISEETDFLEMIANRIHYLINYRKDQIRPLTQSLFEKVVTLFNMIRQTAVKEMEALQIGAMDDEEAMESLFTSKRWKELEVTASMANYRLNKAKYYWALVCPDNSPKKRELLTEAIDGFSFPYNVVHQNAQLTAYSFLGRALCLRELGNLQEAMKELNYIIHKGDQPLPPSILWRARYELARTNLLAGKYHDCLKEVNILFADSTGLQDDPDLINSIKFLKIKASFMLIISKENELNFQQNKDIYSEALIAVKQLIKVNIYWQDQVFSLLTQDSVRNYLRQKDKDDPYIGWILADGLFYEKRFGEAIPFFKMALSSVDSEIYSGRGDINFKLGVCYYNLKQFKEAIPYFANCISKSPKADIAEKAAYLHYKAYENLYREDWNPPYIRALNHYLKNSPQHPLTSDAHYRLGNYYGQREKRLDAIKELEKVKKGSKYFIQARFFIFKYRTQEFESLRLKAGADITQSYRDAIIAREKFLTAIREKGRGKLKREGPDGDNLMGYAAVLSARLFVYGPERKYRQAIEELNNFERLYPHQRELHLSSRILRIDAYQKLLDFKKAKEEVERVIQIYNTDPKAREVLSLLAEQFMENAEKEKISSSRNADTERSKIAILISENLLLKTRETPLEENVQSSLASLYLKVGNYQRAKSMYQEIISKHPHSTKALNGLAEIYEQQEKYKKALEYWRILEENLSVGETTWYETKYKIASTYDKLGNFQQACKILTVTRILHPDLGGKDTKRKFHHLEKKVCSSKDQ